MLHHFITNETFFAHAVRIQWGILHYQDKSQFSYICQSQVNNRNCKITHIFNILPDKKFGNTHMIPSTQYKGYSTELKVFAALKICRLKNKRPFIDCGI